MASISIIGATVISVKEFAGKNSSKVLSLMIEETQKTKDGFIKLKRTVKVFGLIANTDIKEGDVISFSGGDLASENNNGTWFTYISINSFNAVLSVCKNNRSLSGGSNVTRANLPEHNKQAAPTPEQESFDDDIPF